MIKTTPSQALRWSSWCMSLFMAAALTACGGSGSDSKDTQPDDSGGSQNGVEEAGCLDECKKFLNQLVDDFAAQASAATAQAAALPDDGAARPAAAGPRVNGDTVEFDVAATQKDVDHPGELNDAFPASGANLVYLLKVNKASGEITLDNKNGKTYVLKAFDEASYFQDIDYAQTDLADKNKAHYAYIAFNPKEKANVIQKDANLRRQWKLVDGSDHPEPGVSLLIGTHWQDCPGQQSSCDTVMLTTNPSAADEDDGGLGGGGDPAELGGDKGVTGHVNGTQQKVTGPTAMATTSVGGLIAIKGLATSMGGANWDIVIQPTQGVQECNSTEGVFVQYSTLGGIDAWTTANDNGSCSINVGTVSDTEVSGTFTADLGPGDSNGDTSRRSVTRGAFHLTRQ